MASASSATGDTHKSSSEGVMDTPETSAHAGTSSTPETAIKTAGQPLVELAQHLDEYPPTIPDPIVTYYMHSAGFDTTDPRIIRLISVASQKFISDIANDALQHCKMRGAGQSKKAAKDKRYVLTMEDLNPALSEYGIKVKKPHYFP